METKNAIIKNFGNALAASANMFIDASNTLGDNMDENRAILKTLNVILESVRANATNAQNAIDEY